MNNPRLSEHVHCSTLKIECHVGRTLFRVFTARSHKKCSMRKVPRPGIIGGVSFPLRRPAARTMQDWAVGSPYMGAVTVSQPINAFKKFKNKTRQLHKFTKPFCCLSIPTLRCSCYTVRFDQKVRFLRSTSIPDFSIVFPCKLLNPPSLVDRGARRSKRAARLAGGYRCRGGRKGGEIKKRKDHSDLR